MEGGESKKSTKFGHGNPGKPKGAVNKVGKQIKEMVIEALQRAGGVDYLTERANDPRTQVAFLGLCGKAMPLQVQGDPENPLEASIKVTFVKASD